MSKKAITTVVITSLVIIVAVAAYIGLSFDSSSADEIIAPRVYSVQTIKAVTSNVEDHLTYTALIQPSDTEQVMFSTVATIKEIHVKEGDTVNVGQLLVTLDDEAAKRQVDVTYNNMLSAQSAMNSAKSTYDTALNRYNAHVQNTASDPNIIEAKANLDIAISDRDNIQNELNVINAALEPFRADVASAELELATAQTNYDEALLALNANPEDEELIETEKLAKEELDLKTQALAEANLALEEEQTRLDLIAKENELSTQNINVNANQAIYDSLLRASELEKNTLFTASEAAKFSYDSASSAYDSTKSLHEAANENLAQLTYYSKTAGTVLYINGQTGSVATPLAPVVVIGSTATMAQFGVSSEDVGKLELNDTAEVTVKDEIYSAHVSSISVLPDELTRTYLTDVLIDMPPSDILFGELVSVKIFTDKTPGIWLPLNIVLNDGEDYVFAVEDGRAVRKNIEISDVNNDMVLVVGLKSGDEIISQGMKSVKSGYEVEVKTE